MQKLLLCFLWTAGLIVGGGDSFATTVNIGSPVNASTVSGLVTINGTSSLTTVGSVGIGIDGNTSVSAATGKASWSFTWDSTAVANGNHTIDARARTGVSDPSPGLHSITVNVRNVDPSVLSLAYNTGGTRINVAYQSGPGSSLAASGGASPYSWTLVGGALPVGITLNSDGSFSGACTAPGVYTFSLRATDSLGVSQTQSFTMIVNAATLGGTVQSVTFDGPVTGRPVTFSLYLPPGYSANSARYPVVYHLHGINGTHDGEQISSVPANHEAAVAAGLVEPCIIVFPDGYSDSFWADAVNVVKPAETNIMQEIIPYIDANYRTQAGRNRRVIEGFSMGGFGAGKFATKFPDSFVACVIYDGAMLSWPQIVNRHSGPAHDVFNDSESTYNLYSPYNWVVQNSVVVRTTMPFRDSAGALVNENRSWRDALLSQSIAPEYSETGLPHSVGPLLDAQGANSWEFIARAFANASATVTVSFSTSVYSVGEAGGDATVTVTRSGNPIGAVAVDYATVDATAVAGEDYLATVGTLHWANGETGGKSFSVSVLDDHRHEPDETLTLALSNPVGVVLGTATAILAIADDDPAFALASASGGTIVTGRSGISLNTSLTATGGTGPYIWSLDGGSSPPAGLTLSSNGVFSGIPLVAGTFNFTARATDANGNSDSQVFTLSIGGPINQRPTVSWIPDLRASPGAVIPDQTFQVEDVETPAASLTVGATSSNPSLLPDDHIIITGTGGNRTIKLTPVSGHNGVATIAVTATDSGGQSYSRAFTLTIASPVGGDTVPLIASMPNQVLAQNTSAPTLFFAIGDAETSFSGLAVTASSSNTSLVPNAVANLALGGTSAQRTLVVKPQTNQTGRSIITLGVSDGTNVTSTAFVIDVVDADTPPTLAGLTGYQITAPGQSPAARAFTIGDAETPPDRLALRVTSSNPALVPPGNIILGGSDSNRTVLPAPVAGQHGVSVIGVTVTDEQGMTAKAEFVFCVFDASAPNNAVPQPRGIYVLDSSAGTLVNGASMRDANIRNLPFVDGYVLRVEWSQLEPVNGTFDFSIIDNIFSKLPADQKLSLMIASGSLPVWLTDLPGITTYTAGSPTVTRPYPWDAVAQERFRLLLVALGDHPVEGRAFRDNPRLAAINAWIPGLKSGIRDPDEIKIRNMIPGYSRQNMETAVLKHLANVTDNFPKVPVQIGFWTYTDSTAEPPAWEELRQLVLAQQNGTSRPHVGFWMENLAANRPAAGLDPWTGLPNTSFTAPLYFSQNETFVGYQMLGSWSRPFSSAHVDNNLNGTPEDGMDYGFNTFQCRYYEVYQADVDFANYTPEFQRWHDLLHALPSHPASDDDHDGLPLAWEQLYGLDASSANSPYDDTSDHDGLGLLLEYAFNQNPLVNSIAGLPTVTTAVDVNDNQTYLYYHYLRRTDAPQLSYTVQVSNDLAVWNSGPAYTREISATPTGDGVTNLVAVQILPAVGSTNGRQFVRTLVGKP